MPSSRPREEFSPALPEEDVYQRNKPVQSHLRLLLDSGRPTVGMDGGVEVEIWYRRRTTPRVQDATIPFDAVSTAHPIDLHDHPHGVVQKLPKSTFSTSAHMY